MFPVVNPEEEERRRAEKLKEDILTKYLTKEARERLANVRIAHPELAESVEALIVQYALAGKIREPITDEELRELLKSLAGKGDEGKIVFKRK
jgi:programmed cell death protein 5